MSEEAINSESIGRLADMIANILARRNNNSPASSSSSSASSTPAGPEGRRQPASQRQPRPAREHRRNRRRNRFEGRWNRLRAQVNQEVPQQLHEPGEDAGEADQEAQQLRRNRMNVRPSSVFKSFAFTHSSFSGHRETLGAPSLYLGEDVERAECENPSEGRQEHHEAVSRLVTNCYSVVLLHCCPVHGQVVAVLTHALCSGFHGVVA